MRTRFRVLAYENKSSLYSIVSQWYQYKCKYLFIIKFLIIPKKIISSKKNLTVYQKMSHLCIFL